MGAKTFELAVSCRLFTIRGKTGFWRKVPNKIAMNQPEAVRATINGRTAVWFVPAGHQVYNEEFTSDDSPE